MKSSLLSGDVVILGANPAGLLCALSLVERIPRLRRKLIIIDTKEETPAKSALFSRKARRLLEEEGVACSLPAVLLSGLAIRTGAGWSRISAPSPGEVLDPALLTQLLRERLAALGVRALERASQLSLSGTSRLQTERGEINACALIDCERRSLLRPLLNHGARQKTLSVVTSERGAAQQKDALLYVAPTRAGVSFDMPSLQRESRARVEVSLGAPLADQTFVVGVPAVAARGPWMLLGEAAGVDPWSGPSLALSIEYGILAGRFLSSNLGGPLDAWSGVLRASRLGAALLAKQALSGARYSISSLSPDGFVGRTFLPALLAA